MRTAPWPLAGLLCLVATSLAPAQYGDISDVKIAKPEDKVDVEVVPPPEGAIVLFDGKNLDAWVKANGKDPAAWKLVEGGEKLAQGGAVQVQPHSGNIITRQKFGGHFKLHVEF